MLRKKQKEGERMLSWLTNLFSGHHCEEKKTRKKHVRLSQLNKDRIGVDYRINKMSIKDIAEKYDISYETARRTVKNASTRV